MMYQNSVLRALMLIRFDAYIAQIVARFFVEASRYRLSDFQRVTTHFADKGYLRSFRPNWLSSMVTA